MKKLIFILMLFFSFNALSITIDQFVNLEPKIQQGYMIGVIDTQSAQLAPGSGFDKCALNWLKNKSHQSIEKSFSSGVSSMNTATFVILELGRVCNESFEFSKNVEKSVDES